MGGGRMSIFRNPIVFFPLEFLFDNPDKRYIRNIKIIFRKFIEKFIDTRHKGGMRRWGLHTQGLRTRAQGDLLTKHGQDDQYGTNHIDKRSRLTPPVQLHTPLVNHRKRSPEGILEDEIVTSKSSKPKYSTQLYYILEIYSTIDQLKYDTLLSGDFVYMLYLMIFCVKTNDTNITDDIINQILIPYNGKDLRIKITDEDYLRDIKGALQKYINLYTHHHKVSPGNWSLWKPFPGGKRKHSKRKHSIKKHSKRKHSIKKHSIKKHSIKKHSKRKHSIKKHSIKKHSKRKQSKTIKRKHSKTIKR
jgi:hypothetical protein